MADNVTHKVVQGENLTSIAKKYNTTVDKIVELNNIPNPNLIYVGQVLIISGKAATTTSYQNTVTITGFGLQADTTRTVFVTWTWNKVEKTECIWIMWDYQTSDGRWWEAQPNQYYEEVSASAKYHIYNAPENAVAVRVRVRPISKKNETNGAEVEKGWFTTNWKEYSFDDNPPEIPDLPEIYIEGNEITLELRNIKVNATHIEYVIIKNNDPNPKYTKPISIVNGKADWKVTVDADATYMARCRSVRLDKTSDWTDWTAEVSSLPKTPEIDDITILSQTSIKVVWTKVNSTTKYEIQYVAKDTSTNLPNDEDYFDDLNSNAQTKPIEVKSNDGEVQASDTITGLSPGVYLIRMCAVPASGSSTLRDWGDIKEFILGTKPTAPTTWSSTTSAIVGDLLKFYWMHNSEDGSNSQGAEFYILIGDDTLEVPDTWGVNAIMTFSKENNYTWNSYDDAVPVMKAYKVDPDKPSDQTYCCEIDSTQSKFSKGAKILWKVATAGVKEDQNGNLEYGDHSAVKKMNVYTKPSIDNLDLTDAKNEPLGNSTPIEGQDQYLRVLNQFPFNIVATLSEMENQKPTGYYISITANTNYMTTDIHGKEKLVTKGTVVYSKYLDTANANISVTVTPADIVLENNVEYTVECKVALDSNLDATATVTFITSFEGDEILPGADIGINKDDLSAIIRPYVNGETNDLLDVYRIEYDGSFTKINDTPVVDDGASLWISDPHPALDFARYRIVGKSSTTGKITYSDMPLVAIGEKAVVIQWDEDWNEFIAEAGEVLANPTWAGSMLKLPYNINISTNTTKDSTLVEYIGRKRPVSYYGTQIGESQSWSVEIPKSDTETLYAIRRLASWMGDVYVREPSGVGYWATITVSYSQTHRNLTIPISFSITRVEGGV